MIFFCLYHWKWSNTFLLFGEATAISSTARWSHDHFLLQVTKSARHLLPPSCAPVCSLQQKPVWPPHQSNSHSLPNMTPLRLLICMPVSLKTPFVLLFSAARSVLWVSYFLCCSLGLWLDCDVFVLVFKTSVAIHSGGCDPCMCVSDRKEQSLLRGFTVN